ncbi:hypothetical protein C1X05_01125 [Laceyella sacchari]|nr:hypothetical protein C1X05_01125 [Laceyella sacchari]
MFMEAAQGGVACNGNRIEAFPSKAVPVSMRRSLFMEDDFFPKGCFSILNFIFSSQFCQLYLAKVIGS